jgi:hypothetical protein
MKKIILIFTALVLAIPLMAGLGFAGSTTASNTEITLELADAGEPTCTISFSKNVSFGYAVSADEQSYAIVSLHFSGDKKYGTASDTTLIYWIKESTGAQAGAPSDSDSTAINSWTAM